MPKKLLSPDAVRDFLVRRYNNQHQAWLAGGGVWPLVVGLGTPTEKDVIEDAAGVREWATAWSSRTGPGELATEERQFSRIGKQRLPVSLSFAEPADVANAIGQGKRWATASQRHARMVELWPQLTEGNTLSLQF